MTDFTTTHTVNGVTWKFFERDAQNPLWYRYMTTDEINRVFNMDVTASDEAPLGTDELGFFVWLDFLDRPAVIIEADYQGDSTWEVFVARTCGPNYPRPGSAETFDSAHRKVVTGKDEVNNFVEKFTTKFANSVPGE